MRGSALEALIRRSAKRQEGLGLHLTQTGARFIPGRALGPRGETSGRVVGAGGLDFAGDLQGRAVTFDAKSTENRARFDLRLIKPHQAVIVKNAHARGAVAFFLVELGARSPAPAYYALAWPVLRPWWERFAMADAGFIAQDKAPVSIPVDVLAREAVTVPVLRGGALDLVSAIQELQGPGVPSAGSSHARGN